MLNLNLDLIPGFVCGNCGKGFAESSLLLRHIKHKHVRQEKEASDNAPFECYMCRAKCMSMVSMRVHLEKKHPIRRDQKCIICGMKLSLFEQNEHWCIDEEQMDCEYCTESFDSITEMLTHLNSHNEKKFYQCDECKRFYPLKILMKNHVKYHVDKAKTFICDICERGYSSNKLLKKHKNIHTAAKSKFHSYIDRI